jgi:Niemann-Pick C1 protein
MRLPGALAAIVGLGSLALQPIVVAAQGETKVHEKGRCAIRGHCGKQPEDSTRQKLVNLCGSKWSEGAVCCKDEQV